jgi:hypothetical protein
MAVSVSGGEIRDRSKEMLSVSDLAIGRLYRVLLNTVKRVADGNTPIAVDANVGAIRGASGTLLPGVHWHTLVPTHRVQRGVDPAESSFSVGVLERNENLR